jgi:hypothetical protein
MFMKLASLVLISLALVASKSHASPEEDEARAKALVKQLGADDFRARERAAKELADLGAASKKALEEGSRSIDAEVATRSRKLYPHALECYRKERFEQYTAAPESPPPEDLPGIKRWLEVAGTSGDSKLIYVEMLGKYHESLVGLADKPENVTDRFNQLVRTVADRLAPKVGLRIANRKEAMPRPERALFLYLATHPDLKRDGPPMGQNVGQDVYHLVQYGDWTAVLEPRYGREAFKKMFVEYLARERNELPLRAAMEIVVAEELKPAVPTLLRIAGDQKRNAQSRSFALTGAAKLSGKDILPDLVPFLDDPTPVVMTEHYRPKREVEMRDAALGIAVVMTGQKLTDYGFNRDLPPNIGAGSLLSDVYFSFPSEEARTRGMKKWGEFVAREKLLPETKK